MIFGKAVIWTVRMLLVSLFVTFLLIIGSDFSDSGASTQQLQFQKTYFDIMPHIVVGGVVDEAIFTENYFEELLGERSKLGFLIRLQNETGVIDEIYYKKEYYSSRIYLVKGTGYTEYSGLFPVMFEEKEVDLYYSYVVAS